MTLEEGLCIQCMHIGAYDDEFRTLALIDIFVEDHGYEKDISEKRLHHEIYLSDVRRVVLEKLRTVIRIG